MNDTINRQLGTKWFTFYTKVRPWFACIMVLSVIGDFIQYQEVYTTFWWMMVYFLAALIQPILCIVVFVKSQGDYGDFVHFVKGVLWFETINIAYQQAVQQYINNDFNLGLALVMFLIIFTLAFFLWYRLNIKYFKKRIIVATNDYSSNGANTNQFVYPNKASIIDVDRIRFCRKCGEKLVDNSRFCRKCGTEIVD